MLTNVFYIKSTKKMWLIPGNKSSVGLNIRQRTLTCFFVDSTGISAGHERHLTQLQSQHFLKAHLHSTSKNKITQANNHCNTSWATGEAKYISINFQM